MKRVLILGGSGFIGETLYKELCSYFDTYATYCSSKSFKHNQHYYQFNMDEGGLEAIIKDVKPKLIISALRGNFESQLETHDFLTDFIKKNNCRLLFLSSANVFDAFQHYPSYEYDKTLSESIYGRLKIRVENGLLRLPTAKYVIARLPMVFGQHSPRVREIDWAVQQQIPIEVFPNSVINVNSDRKLAQQIHYIINRQLSGVFHLGSHDLIGHFEFIKAVVERRNHKKATYKQVFTTNEMRYLATLPKENKLPEHLQIGYHEVLDDMDLIRKII